MKKYIWKKLLAALLAVCLLAGALPLSAGAAVSANTIVANAQSLVGKYPYVYGGESPSEGGFDCSGLVYYVYNKMSGVNITLSQAGRGKAALAGAGTKITGISNFLPGDIVQFNYPHVAIYIGDSTIIEAAKSGTMVRTRRITSSSGVEYAVRLSSVTQGGAVVGKTSKPSVSVNGQTVTVSWTYSGSASYIDVYLIQQPWGPEDIKYHQSTTGNSVTFYNVADNGTGYAAYTVARPNPDSCSSDWADGIYVTPPHTTHTWDNGKVTKEATITETGVKTYTCTVCGTTKTESIPKLANATGKCGDNVTWNYDSGTGVLTISGTGDMYDYPSSINGGRKNPWEEIGICFKEIRISSGVTSIGAEAFRQNSRRHDDPKALVSVSIPNTVKRIGYHAFSGNKGLKSVTIPSSVTSIETSAFWECTNLKECKIPSSVTFLGNKVFFKAPLTGAVWENGLRYYCGWVIETETETSQLKYSVKQGTVGISGAAFYDAGWLKDGKIEVNIPEGVSYIGESCFWECFTLEKIVIPDSVVKLEQTAFLGCGKLKEVKLSKNITSIGDRTFENCYRLTTVEIPKGVTSIGNKAFCNCKDLSSVTIPNTVTSIASDAFLYSTNVAISCNSGSYAETYAKKNGIPYTILDDGEVPSDQGVFSDVPSDAYYAQSVAWAVENGITSGTGKGKFSPDAACTRAQAVTFLWRLEGSPSASPSSKFTDVSSNAYYSQAVNWAVQQGITSGTGENRFSPDAVCSRAQIVTFLYRAAHSPSVSDSSTFSDVTAGAYYENAVKWAVENEITSGTGKGRFSPADNCARGQIVTFLYRYAN